MKIISGSEFQEIITGVVAGSVVVLGFLTKDADKSHTDNC
jgi:primosomal replication protein N